MNKINSLQKSENVVKFNEIGVGRAFLLNNAVHLKTADNTAFNLETNTQGDVDVNTDVFERHLNITVVKRRREKKAAEAENENKV